MDSYDSNTHTVITNSNRNHNNPNNSVSMPSTTSNETFANIGGLSQTTTTLTPTTLKNIEESFMEIIPPQSRPHPQEARFVPPLVNISANYASINSNYNLNNDLNTSSNNSNSNASDLEFGSDYESDEDSSSRSDSHWNAYVDRHNTSANNGSDYNKQKVTATKVRGKSGRKPMRNDKLTPAEEKKRQQRRERNKQAAARCRKRRMDHTNSLLIETDGLEEKRQSLLNEVEALRKQKDELEAILATHKMNCKMNSLKVHEMDVKPVVSNGSVIAINTNPRSRPNTLSLGCVYSDPMSDTGIPIQTPSTGIFLEALAEGGTGLTPVLTPSVITPSSTSYNSRQRMSPNADNSHKKLITL
ncbi:unnamed protein product [Medioppia subpectinata]|uniref:BZIP domain-containing protein n=1 Tax=Medioppia subpectinata TaxID=1979941 RepID=A0A7R9PYG3_9ACAR|nr:unnamed protein product [Medioppia subpectinata]CAG2106056.1 unnamed protein product [Medioppia subpectinata]